ncbi:hypothetical protein ACIPY3_22260 [Paenarthrobacter sp. NPDC089714]|uniref:hypothetical protein n=1 Tax=Paenarthrobacter sp. NPDC089714 TaxID=3364377 RepID=UPI00382BBA6A
MAIVYTMAIWPLLLTYGKRDASWPRFLFADPPNAGIVVEPKPGWLCVKAPAA